MFATKWVKLAFCASLLLVSFSFVWLVKGHATDLQNRSSYGDNVLGVEIMDTPLSIAIATGDFNHDGFRDVALVNRNFPVVLVYLNNQDGTFADPIFVPVGNGPVGIATGDFYNHEILDLVVANSGDNTLSILKGKGDGTFEPAPTVAVGNTPTGVAVEDFDEDNNEDIVVTNSGDNTVSVLLGFGNGTFRSAPRSPYRVGNNPVAVVVEDFNGDRVKDLAVANAGSGTISILIGEFVGDRSTGTFKPAVDTRVMDGVAVIVAEDFNGDDNEDLAVANPASNKVSVLFGMDNPPYLRSGPTLTLPVSGGATAIEAEALRANSTVQDIIVASADSDTVTVFLGNGRGQFGSPTGYNVPGGPSALAGHNYHAPPPGDGINDVAVATTDNVVLVLYGNGDGTLIGP